MLVLSVINQRTKGSNFARFKVGTRKQVLLSCIQLALGFGWGRLSPLFWVSKLDFHGYDAALGLTASANWIDRQTDRQTPSRNQHVR